MIHVEHLYTGNNGQRYSVLVPGGAVNESLSRRTVTFVIRIWAEYLEQTPPVWRGEIECVGSDEKAYVRELADVLGFIRQHALGMANQGEEDSHHGCAGS